MKHDKNVAAIRQITNLTIRTIQPLALSSRSEYVYELTTQLGKFYCYVDSNPDGALLYFWQRSSWNKISCIVPDEYANTDASILLSVWKPCDELIHFPMMGGDHTNLMSEEAFRQLIDSL